MNRLWITGYRSYELGIFNDKDIKADVIKWALKQELSLAIENGTNWIISGGQLGIEQWSLEVANELRQEYTGEFKTALMTPFSNFGNQWNEINQEKLRNLKNKVDFFGEVSQRPYENPQQLRNYQDFMLSHTDQSILVYDLEHTGKSQYDYDAIQNFSKAHSYIYKLINFDDLQEFAIEYQESLNNGLNFE
ncbi:DUF1273 domain-containing protein [Lentilactobacillus laojiaonis]|uniref:DUF1273 domain-containing protein n=1 Tax=Lentilactobacillus laojiaonis TaxID=2883998 RepID=UPI001D0A13ED|nr:DUF1273 domain-containing protein [Lentilactobacillus laojiaonis]UDM32726.1 DUF1273 domain-containing protein [Lentilactobacillus laojiaonis]